MFEAEIEKVVRRHVHRGTITVHIRVERVSRPTDLNLNSPAIVTYLRQIRDACNEAGTPEYAAPVLAGLLALPGVAPEARHFGSPPEDEWPVVEATLVAALRASTRCARRRRAMGDELLAHHQTVANELRPCGD